MLFMPVADNPLHRNSLDIAESDYNVDTFHDSSLVIPNDKRTSIGPPTKKASFPLSLKVSMY